MVAKIGVYILLCLMQKMIAELKKMKICE